jgi:hypothetical protein
MSRISVRLTFSLALVSAVSACAVTPVPRPPAPQSTATSPVDFALKQMAEKGERREHVAERRAVAAYRACLGKSVLKLSKTAEASDVVVDAAFADCIPSGLAATHADPFVPPGAEEQALAILNVSTRGFVVAEVARDRGTAVPETAH